MKLVIDRSKWARGKTSSLRDRENGKQCCLGFFARACGFAEEEITGVGTPAMLLASTRGRKEPTLDIFLELKVEELDENDLRHPRSEAFMRANDRRLSTETWREQRIAELFKRIGVDVEFVDGEEAA